MNLQCLRCSHVYASTDQDVANIYPAAPDHDHIITRCPACKCICRIFMKAARIQEFVNAGVCLQTNELVPKAIAALARKVREGEPAEKKAKDNARWQEAWSKDIEPPREWVLSVLDTIRHYENPCHGECK